MSQNTVACLLTCWGSCLLPHSSQGHSPSSISSQSCSVFSTCWLWGFSYFQVCQTPAAFLSFLQPRLDIPQIFVAVDGFPAVCLYLKGTLLLSFAMNVIYGFWLAIHLSVLFLVRKIQTLVIYHCCHLSRIFQDIFYLDLNLIFNLDQIQTWVFNVRLQGRHQKQRAVLVDCCSLWWG